LAFNYDFCQSLDSSLFWKIVDGSDGDFILDSDRALKEGEKVKDYVIEFGE